MSGAKLTGMHNIAKALLTPGKGLLAADENLAVISERFAAIGLHSTVQNRRAYREMLFTSPHIADFISGVIVFDATIHQRTSDGIPMIDILKEQGVIPGITVDRGTRAFALFPGERITEGIDGLRYRLAEYKELGAHFTKWRAVLKVGHQIPTQTCISTNASLLAYFAALSQEAGLVPVVEPEVLIEGDCTLSLCEEISQQALRTVFHTLEEYRVDLTALILKTNMVTPATYCRQQVSTEQVAQATLRCLSRSVPTEVPGIVFLSGGQTEIQASERLNAISRLNNGPWRLSFSFGRTLKDSALRTWNGLDVNISEAQWVFLHRAWCNCLALEGKYDQEIENSPVDRHPALAVCA